MPSALSSEEDSRHIVLFRTGFSFAAISAVIAEIYLCLGEENLVYLKAPLFSHRQGFI